MQWKEKHEELATSKEMYVFEGWTLFNGFTLSFRKKDAPNRSEAEKLICELIRDSLEEGIEDGEAKTSVWIEINTDCKETPTGYHVAFKTPLTKKQEMLLEVGLEKHRKRRGLGNKPFFYRGSLVNPESYFWKNSGSPTEKKISLRKKRKHTRR